MKKTFFTLIILFLVLTGAYTGYWWYQTQELKKFVLTLIKEEEARNENQLKISYDSIHRKGFPFSVGIGLKNPQVIWLNNDSLVLQAPSEISLQGMMTIGNSIFSDRVWTKVNGEIHFFPQGKAGSGNVQEENYWIVSGNFFVKGTSLRHLQWNGTLEKKLLTKQVEFLKKFFENVSFKGDHLAVSYFAVDHAIQFASLDKAIVYYQNKEVEDDRNHFYVDVDLQGLEFFQDIDQNPIFQKLPFPDKVHLQLLAASGKNDFHVEAHASLPAYDQFLQTISLDTLPEFSIVLDKYTTKSDFGSSTHTGKVELNRSKPGFLEGSLLLDIEAKFSEKYHKELVRIADLIVQELKKSSPAEEQKKFDKLLGANREEFYRLIPNPMDFGTFASHLNFYVQMEKEPNSNEMKQIHFQVKNSSASSDLYGIVVDSDLLQKEKAPFQGTSKVQVTQYKALVQDVVNYYNRLTHFLAYSGFIEKEAMVEANPELQKKILQFLVSISDERKEDSSTLTVTITNQDSQVKIGSLSLDEFLNSWMKLRQELSRDPNSSL